MSLSLLRIFFFSLVLSGLYQVAQTQPEPEPAIFSHITHTPSGFTQKEVKDILQDRDGFIWIATTHGLFRHDGHDMRLYQQNPLDPTSIGSNFIVCLAIDADSALWIGTLGAGLFRYDRFKDAFVHYPLAPEAQSGSFSNEINDLLLDSQGRLWVATNEGLGLVDRQTERLVPIQNSKSDSVNIIDFTCLAEDQQQQIWAGVGDLGGGLYKINPETQQFTRFMSTSDGIGMDNTRVIALAADTKGDLWFSTEDTRLHRIEPISHQIESFTFPHNLKNTAAAIQSLNIWAIEPDTKGNLWLGTHASGLIHFSPGSGRRLYYRNDPLIGKSLPSDGISVLFLDANGTLWLGHNGNGISQLNTHPSGFERLAIAGAPSLPDPSYKCVLEDRAGKVWVGSWGNGISLYDPGTGKTEVFRHQANNPQSLANNMVWDILEDRKGDIWFATHGGLQRFSPQQSSFETFGLADGLEHEAIRSLCEDDQGTLWIGTFGGLHRRDSDTSPIRFVEGYSPNPYAIVNEIFADSHEHIWVATLGKGLYRLDLATQEWTFFAHNRKNPHSLSSNIVLDIIEDAQAQIWFGTQGGGLDQLVPHPSISDSAHFRHWRPYNSALPTENIFNLAADSENTLWLSTDIGLYSFDPQTEAVKPYSLPAEIQGLSAETEPGAQGNLYVGNAHYIYRFLPGKIHKNAHIPPVFITDIHIQDQSIPIRHKAGDSLSQFSPLLQSVLHTSSLKLAYDQNDLTFTFTALNYIEAADNQYAYQLQGYDEDWIPTDAFRRHARYTNLSPGTYTFHVKAANNEGIWNEEGTSIRVRILPPWWLTWWAYCAYAFICFFLIRSVYVFQLTRKLAEAEATRLKELDAAKTRLITNVTHEFRTPLTVILGMAQQIRENPTQWLSQGIDAITRSGQQVLKLVNQMMDLSQLESGNLPVTYKQGNIMTFLGYLVASFQSYAVSQEVTLILKKESEIIQMDFAPELLAQIVNNLISNAIKFSPNNSTVEVGIREIGNQLEIRVLDNGPGIPDTHLPHIFDRFFQVDNSHTRAGEGTGIGLALVKELVDIMQGSIQVESAPDIRTSFRVLLPITNAAPQWLGEFERNPSLSITSPPSFSLTENEEAPLVLIIEDNADVANYTASCLQHTYRMSFAENGRMGIEKAFEQVPDIIICDIMMPEVDGYEVCTQVKKDERTNHIPIILLTAKNDNSSRIKGLRLGAEAYLAKPFNREELEVRLEKLLEIRKHLQKKFATFPQVAETILVPTPLEDAFMHKLRGLIHAHLEEETYGITDLCLELAVSRTQLHRKLKAITGRPTSHVIRSIRLEKARELILQTDLNISEVAFQTGFGNHSYFSALFAEEFGDTPTEIRKKSDLKQ